MTCSIFIASTTATCWPSRTSSPSATLIATMVPWIGEATPTEPSGPVRSGAASSAAAADGRSAFTAASCANSASGSRLLTRAPAKPGVASAPAGRRLDKALALLALRRERRRRARRASACGPCRRRSPDAPGCCAGSAMLVLTPSSRNSLSARVVAADRDGEIRRRRMRDHLGEQRIERAARCVAGVAEAVGAHARSVRRLIDA